MSHYKNIVVKVPRRNAGWQYGRNQWQEWCAVNCRGDFAVTSRNRDEILAGFDLECDAALFLLRWA